MATISLLKVTVSISLDTLCMGKRRNERFGKGWNYRKKVLVLGAVVKEGTKPGQPPQNDDAFTTNEQMNQ